MTASEKVKRLIGKIGKDIIILDALYQWAATPTGYTAIGNGFYPDHSLIKGNLKIRYSISNKEAEEIYDRLKWIIESVGLDFRKGFLEVEDKINEYFEQNPVLCDGTLKRLSLARDKEKYNVWLFCKVKDNYFLRPEYHPRRFQALLNLIFDTDTEPQEYLPTLIRVGFLNELEWIGSKYRYDNSKKENLFVFPKYLGAIAEKIDEYITLPSLPDFNVFINTLFDRFGGRIEHGSGHHDIEGERV